MSPTLKRQHYREIANRYRRIPGEHGLRPWRVFAVVGVWSGSGHFGDGIKTETETEILEQGQPPKVRHVRDEVIALGVNLQTGDMVIGPITPVVGTPWSTMTGDAAAVNNSFLIRLVNAETGDSFLCTVVTVSNDRALRTMITVRPQRS